MMPRNCILPNSALAMANLMGGSLLALAWTGGPCVGIKCSTQGLEGKGNLAIREAYLSVELVTILVFFTRSKDVTKMSYLWVLF